MTSRNIVVMVIAAVGLGCTPVFDDVGGLQWIVFHDASTGRITAYVRFSSGWYPSRSAALSEDGEIQSYRDLEGKPIPKVGWPPSITPSTAHYFPSFFRNRHRSICNMIYSLEAPVELLFLGDSITQGWSSWSAPEEIREVWEEFYADLDVFNAGSGGDMIQNVSWRLSDPCWDEVSPRLIVLNIGTNNSFKSNLAGGNAEGILALLAKLTARFQGSEILLMGLFPRGRDRRDPQRVMNKEVNELIEGFGSIPGVRYLDISSSFLDESGAIRADLFGEALLHPSHLGYRIWAREIEPIVDEVLAESH